MLAQLSEAIVFKCVRGHTEGVFRAVGMCTTRSGSWLHAVRQPHLRQDRFQHQTLNDNFADPLDSPL